MANLPPKLGPFEPLYRLGAGGMAETFVAVRRGPAGFEQRVCIKRILPAYEDDLEFVQSFIAEARMSAALRHMNIVQVLDFGKEPSDGSHYLALELIDGCDLRALLQQSDALDAELVGLIATELAAALAHAHTADEERPAVVHRDLSPSNVLVSRAGELKLTDFGIARALGDVRRTATGVIKGKVPYMPPEYITAGQFDERGDLFALGVVLFELAHGERPFDGASELDTLRRIVAGERRPFVADAPPGLVRCIERLLATRPEERFESAHALLDALPPVSAHHARGRLAALVRTHVASSSDLRRASALPKALMATVPLTPSDEARPSTTQPTRTALRPDWLRPSRAALFSLAAAAGLLLVVVIAGVVRGQLRPAGASAPPQLPAVSEAPVGRAHGEPRSTSPSIRAVEPEAEPIPAKAPAPVDQSPPDRARKEPAAASTAASELHAAERDVAKPASAESAPTSRPVRAGAQAELHVVVYPYGDVWIDDKYRGQAPLKAKLSPGSHVIAVGEGRVRERRTVQLEPGDRERMVFRFPANEH